MIMTVFKNTVRNVNKRRKTTTISSENLASAGKCKNPAKDSGPERLFTVADHVCAKIQLLFVVVIFYLFIV